MEEKNQKPFKKGWTIVSFILGILSILWIRIMLLPYDIREDIFILAPFLPISAVVCGVFGLLKEEGSTIFSSVGIVGGILGLLAFYIFLALGGACC